MGCGWEARLLKEVEPFITKGIGIDFKAPNINSKKLHTFSYFFESKNDKFAETSSDSAIHIKIADSAILGGGI